KPGPYWPSTALACPDGLPMEQAWIPLALTLKVAGWATLITMVLGVALGYLLARTRFPGRDLLDAVLTLPMVLPPTVIGYYLLVLVGRNGPVGEWLLGTFGIHLIFTWQGAVLAAAIVRSEERRGGNSVKIMVIVVSQEMM